MNLLCQLVRRFRWEWHQPPMRYKTSIIRSSQDPLKFTVSERSN